MTRAGRGFALAELIVALVIAGIIGVALTRLVVNQARFVAMQDAMMQARGGARSALNVLIGEMRMVPGGGVIDAATDSVTLRVPYAFGIACGRTSGNTIVSLFPADSATYFSAVPSGYAWRDATGHYVFENGATVTDGVALTTCTSAAITTASAPGWPARAAAVTQNLATDTAAAILLYQDVRYAFAPSVELPGRQALWRTVLLSGAREELVAPFDTTAKFTFLVGSRYTAQTAPPTPLDSLRGVLIRLTSTSENPPEGRSLPTTFDVSVNVYFRNYEP